MAEEFDESEIIFSDSYYPIRRREADKIEKENRPVDFRQKLDDGVGVRSKNKSRRIKTAPFSTSLPVNVPMMRRYSSSSDEDEEEYSGGKMVPPHLIVGRRMEGGQMAFSVCTGNGRTLKGRDLSRVRNSVLRLTGFLEA